MSDIVVLTPDDLDHDTLVVNTNKVEVATASATQKGATTLATAAAFPLTGDTQAVTPDYLAAALAAMPDVFE